MGSTYRTIGFRPTDHYIVLMKRRNVLGIHGDGSITADRAERAKTFYLFGVRNEMQDVAKGLT